MKYIFRVLIFMVGVVVQWWGMTYFSFFGLSPQVLLVLTVVVASQAGPGVSLSLAFFWGLFLDALGAHLFGGNALALILTAYLIGALRRQMDVTNPLSQAMVAVIVSWVYFLFMAVLGLMFRGEAFWVGWTVFCFVPILNGLIAPIGFSFVQGFFKP